jgi:DNA-binding LacI/PurR family transcriptional regulator
MAIGAMDAAFAAGMDVPGDLAIVGVDDIDAAGLVRPALTTVRVPAEEIGRAAGELLLHRIDAGAADSHRHVLVQHALIARDSA